jgi:hypothetical protein
MYHNFSNITKEILMNIEVLNDIISLFEKTVVKNGLNRDLTDSIQSMGSNQNNIVNLRSIASKIEGHLSNVYNSELPDLLFTLFPQKK